MLYRRQGYLTCSSLIFGGFCRASGDKLDQRQYGHVSILRSFVYEVFVFSSCGWLHEQGRTPRGGMSLTPRKRESKSLWIRARVEYQDDTEWGPRYTIWHLFARNWKWAFIWIFHRKAPDQGRGAEPKRAPRSEEPVADPKRTSSLHVESSIKIVRSRSSLYKDRLR